MAKPSANAPSDSRSVSQRASEQLRQVVPDDAELEDVVHRSRTACGHGPLAKFREGPGCTRLRDSAPPIR